MNKNAYTVTQVNHYIAHMFQEDFALNGITVSGEISNLKYHTSGHIYFTLKDTASQISGIMFAGDRAGLKFKLENGMKVLVTGTIGVYQRGGSYQIYARGITSDGIGDLYIRFEQLKQELSEMGMFDPMYKKPIPKYAQKIGIVTAKTGAAIRDIVQIARRRNPYVELVLYPALVQGDGAAQSIVSGIKTLDKMNLDVIIIGRGGGSIEDLWAFNEEPVAKAVFDANTPIISAVGHEIDTTITDYTADLRAPTPSAAAELAVFDYQQFMESLAGYKEAFSNEMQDKLHTVRQRISDYRLKTGKYNPRTVLLADRQRTMELEGRLKSYMEQKVREARNTLEQYKALRVRLDQIRQDRRHRLEILTAKMELMSPLKKLSGGYGYIQDSKGRRVDSIQKVQNGEQLITTVLDGEIISIVDHTVKREEP
jgi:exodeoxyribonuclease VII large subunit